MTLRYNSTVNILTEMSLLVHLRTRWSDAAFFGEQWAHSNCQSS